MEVKFNDLRVGDLYANMEDAFQDVLFTGKFILGERVREFEDKFGRYIGADYCAGVGSGFDALKIALMYSVKPGDDVLVPSNAPLPVWMAVTDVGANVISVPPGRSLVLEKIDRQRYTMKTKAIIVVHQYGLAVDIPSLRIPHQVAVIEDCAQAHGAEINVRKVGSIGDFGCFSFYPTKNLGCYGDGGAITTSDKARAYYMNVARQYGMGDVQGVNSRLDELQAAFLSIKLETLDKENARRIDRARRYSENLCNIDRITLPQIRYDGGHVYHQYVILADKRDKLQAFLLEEGVETKIHYKFPPMMTKFYASNSGPVSRDVEEIHADQVLSLPIANATNDEIDYVCDKIHEFYNV
jgi:dTDP-4-amino-4,6-dideoxygalactose transaminase